MKFKNPIVSSLPALGYGAASIGNLYKAVDERDALDTVKAVFDSGIHYIDTAPHYGFGLSEKRLGHAIAEFGKPDGLIISSKVGRRLAPDSSASNSIERQAFFSPEPFISEFDYSYDAVMQSWESSCKRLGVDKIDILYVHDIGSRTHGEQHQEHLDTLLQDGYKALAELKEQGLVDAIGLGVNEWEICRELMDHIDLDIFLLAGRYTLLEQEPLDTLFPQCEQQGIGIVIGGPYNSGVLATGVKHTKNVNFDYGPAPEHIINKVRQIETLCDEYSIPLPAAALQFALAPKCVASVIPGISSAATIERTLDAMALEIPTAFWETLISKGLILEDSPLPV